MNILVTGAQFGNKGAQSLLFSLVSEIKKKYADAKIYYVPLDDISGYDIDHYKFNFVYDDLAKYDCKELIRGTYRKYKAFVVKRKAKKNKVWNKCRKLSDIWSQMNIMVDICGYNLSSKWPMEINNRFLRYIDTAKKHNLPVILMPQSLGPFEYNDLKIDNHIRETLHKVDVICAREQQGVEDLKKKYDVSDNVYLYPDLVLISGKLEKKYIYSDTHELKERKLTTEGNVGIVPNEQLLSNANEKIVLKLYEELIDKLLDNGKNVYIFRHSDDLDLCRKIYDRCKSDKVVLIRDEFDCFEYSEFVKQFDFIVASRFHSIVHAYKNEIPAIILGWSVKYDELSKLFRQEKYVFNIENVNKNNVMQIVEKMCENHRTEAAIIHERLCNNILPVCYEKLWNLLDGMG